MDECMSNENVADDREILFCFSFHVILNGGSKTQVTFHRSFVAGHCFTFWKVTKTFNLANPSPFKKVKQWPATSDLLNVTCVLDPPYFKPMQVYIRLLFLGLWFLNSLKTAIACSFTLNITDIWKSSELRFNESPGSSYIVTEVCSLSSVMYSLYCMFIFNQFNLIIINFSYTWMIFWFLIGVHEPSANDFPHHTLTQRKYYNTT